MDARLYTIPGCLACETARTLLDEYTVIEMPADDPLIALAIRTMFREWFAPVVVIEDDVFVVAEGRLYRAVVQGKAA